MWTDLSVESSSSRMSQFYEWYGLSRIVEYCNSRSVVIVSLLGFENRNSKFPIGTQGRDVTSKMAMV